MKNAAQFHIRPPRPEEAGLFYTPHPEEDKRLGTVGHVRMDFGRSGNEFWHTWWPRGPEELNSPAFKAELQEVVDTLRESVLKNRFAMERFCYEHGGKISGGWTQNYGYTNHFTRIKRNTVSLRQGRIMSIYWIEEGFNMTPPEQPTLSEIKPEKEQAGSRSSCFYACGGGQIQHHN